MFRCSLQIDAEFPRKPPKGYFLTKIFHPNVAANGEICVNTLKKDWNPQNWALPTIFEVIRCLLIVPFPESSLNEQAGRLFIEDYDEYAKTARLYTAVHAACKTPQPVSQNSVNVFYHGQSSGLAEGFSPKCVMNVGSAGIGTVPQENFMSDFAGGSPSKKDSEEVVQGSLSTHLTAGMQVKDVKFLFKGHSQEEVVLHSVTNNVMNKSLGANAMPFAAGPGAEVLKHEQRTGSGSFPFASGLGGGVCAPGKKANDKKKWMKRI